MSDISNFYSGIVDLAYDGMPRGVARNFELERRKRSYATALRSLYARHGKHISRRSERYLSALAEGGAAVGSCTIDALAAGIPKLEILAHARLCFTSESKQ